jgi:hypothetical protein
LKKLDNHRKRNWILALPFLLILPISILIPEAIAALLPSTYLVELVGRIFPFIEGYATLSLFPHVTRLTFTVAMVMAAILLPVFLYYQLKIQDFAKLNSSPGMRYLGWAAGSLALMPFFMMGPVPGQSIRSLPIDLIILQYKLALGIYAALLSMFEIIFLAMPVVWIKSKFLKRN